LEEDEGAEGLGLAHEGRDQPHRVAGPPQGLKNKVAVRIAIGIDLGYVLTLELLEALNVLPSAVDPHLRIANKAVGDLCRVLQPLRCVGEVVCAHRQRVADLQVVVLVVVGAVVDDVHREVDSPVALIEGPGLALHDPLVAALRDHATSG
jgi:hypothetical protein